MEDYEMEKPFSEMLKDKANYKEMREEKFIPLNIKIIK